MSTLSIDTPRTSGRATRRGTSASDVDARFDGLVHHLVPAQRVDRTGVDRTGVDFENVFDLDYAQPALSLVPSVSTPPAARRVRVAPVKPRRVPPRAVRLTRRGRLVVLLAFVAFALAAMTALGGWAAASLSGGTPERVRVIEVASGDTLYDIAADLAQPGEIRAMVHRIQELNSLPGAQISEGQKLAVPRG